MPRKYLRDKFAAALKVTNRERCEKPGTEAAMEEIARSVCNYEPGQLGERTDLGNAELFSRLHSDHVRHVVDLPPVVRRVRGPDARACRNAENVLNVFTATRLPRYGDPITPLGIL